MHDIHYGHKTSYEFAVQCESIKWLLNPVGRRHQSRAVSQPLSLHYLRNTPRGTRHSVLIWSSQYSKMLNHIHKTKCAGKPEVGGSRVAMVGALRSALRNTHAHRGKLTSCHCCCAFIWWLLSTLLRALGCVSGKLLHTTFPNVALSLEKNYWNCTKPGPA